MLNARGCTDAAVALVDSYRAANARRLTPEQRRETAFHLGQALAFADRRTEALRWFVIADEGPGASEEWRAYVAAHVAFFRRDNTALTEARRRYIAVSGPDSMRLKFIDGLVRCPDKPYMEAAHCAM